MKKSILITVLLMFTTMSWGQKKSAKVSLEVNGNCHMCKKRIEKVALKTKGVKYANWNVQSHQLKLIIDERKVDTLTVQKAIASVGHDTKAFLAKDRVYNELHTCCKYRNEENTVNHNQ